MSNKNKPYRIDAVKINNPGSLVNSKSLPLTLAGNSIFFHGGVLAGSLLSINWRQNSIPVKTNVIFFVLTVMFTGCGIIKKHTGFTSRWSNG